MEENNKEIIPNVGNLKNLSDGHHTFKHLYKHRTALFCVICNCNPDISWKSKKHFDEENDPMFNGDFVAGIETPKGTVTYHMKLEYWNKFKVPERDRAPRYDGHDGNEDVERLFSLSESYAKSEDNLTEHYK